MKKYIYGLFIASLAASLFCVGCKPKKEAVIVSGDEMPVNPQERVAEIMKSVALQIDGEPIYNEAIAREVARIAKANPDLDKNQQAQVVMQVVHGLIMRNLWQNELNRMPNAVSNDELQVAFKKYRSTLPSGTTVEAALEKEGLTQDEFLTVLRLRLFREKREAAAVAALGEIPERDVQEYYQRNIKTLNTPASVDARQIVISTQAMGKEPKEVRAQEAWKRLNAGEDFAEVAWEYSDDKTRSDGGRIGRVWEGMARDKSLGLELFALKEGETSRVIKYRDAYYIFHIDAYHPAKTYTEDEVKNRIREVLGEQRRIRTLYTVSLELMRRYKVEFFGNIAGFEEPYYKTFFPEIARERAIAAAEAPDAE